MSTATRTVNIVSKSQLARLLATENIKIEHSRKAQTASFNTNTRTLVLPVWNKASEDMYDLLVAHEIGHALHTPAEDVYLPICKEVSPSNPEAFFPYLNLVEDIRIEAAMKESYPGLRRSFFNGYRDMADADFFELKDVDIASLPFGDRLNLHAKIGVYGFVDVPFTDDERKIVDAAFAAKTFEQVAAVAKQIFENGAGRGPEPKKEPVLVNIAGGSGNAGNGESVDTDQKGTPNGTSDAESDETPQTGENGNNASSGTHTANTRPPKLKTVESLNEKMKNLSDRAYGDQYSYFDMPRLDLSRIVFDYKRVYSDLAFFPSQSGYTGDKIYASIVDRNKDFVLNLVKQFEQKMAADTLQRSRTARTGSLDMRKIANYKFSEDLFLKNTIVEKGKSHGMVFIMDWSGSMSNYLMPTVEQLLALCMFCRRMNIPFDVYAFTNAMPYGDADSYGFGSAKENAKISPDYTTQQGTNYYGQPTEEVGYGNFLELSNIGMIQLLSSRMNNNDFKRCAEILCQLAVNNDGSGMAEQLNGSFCHIPNDNYAAARTYSLSGTPLNSAIVAGTEIVAQFRRQYGVEIVNTIILTDGEAGDSVIRSVNGNAILNLPTREQFPIIANGRDTTLYGGCRESRGLIEVMKRMTGCNVIGIRLTGNREATSLALSYGSCEKDGLAASARMTQEWKENDFFSYRQFGYTEAFVINAKTDIVTSDDLLSGIREGATVGVIARAFIRNSAKMKTSRVLLSRFSDLIARKVLA